MQVRKQNPNRWYLVMIFCILLAFCVFIIAPRIGYSQENAHALAIMIGVWLPPWESWVYGRSCCRRKTSSPVPRRCGLAGSW